MSFSLSTGNTVYASASATTSSSTDTTATIKVTASAYITNGWVQSTGVVAIITINGSSSTKTVFGNGTKYTASEGTKSVSYSVSVSKTTATQSISWSVKFYQYTDGTQQSLKQTNSGTVSVAKKTSYAITYNANGGSGAPSAQTKWHGTALTLSTTKPTRTGYSFSKWNTASGGTGTSYASGASYTANAAATLYAQWTANTYTISFNANGGTGAPSSQTKTYGVTLTLSSTVPTRTNYNFLGWATSASATTAQYAAGGSFTTNAATTLYAVWELAYWKPIITNMKVARCASDGTLNDFGTYALVSFDWECCQLLGANNASEITIVCNGVTTTLTPSATSGTVSEIVGADALSVDNAYAVTVTVTDTIQSGSSSLSKTVSKAEFVIDFLAGGSGVAIGKPADTEGALDVNGKIICRKPTNGIFGTHPDSGETYHQFQPINGSGQLALGYGLYNAGLGSTDIYGNDVYIISRGNVYSNRPIVLANNKDLYGTTTDGVLMSLADLSDGNNTVFGYGGYSNERGTTRLCGYDLSHYVSNIATPGYYRPYLRRGDSYTVTIYTAGYLTSSKTQIAFFVPFTRPIIGSPTVTATSGDGFILRQNGAYTHGSAASTAVHPDSYTAVAAYSNGVRVQAIFSTTTNAVNNSPIGIHWNGIITFS